MCPYPTGRCPYRRGRDAGAATHGRPRGHTMRRRPSEDRPPCDPWSRRSSLLTREKQTSGESPSPGRSAAASWQGTGPQLPEWDSQQHMSRDLPNLRGHGSTSGDTTPFSARRAEDAAGVRWTGAQSGGLAAYWDPDLNRHKGRRHLWRQARSQTERDARFLTDTDLIHNNRNN